MVEQLSPLGAALRRGRHGNISGQPGIWLRESRPGSIVELAAWPGQDAALRGAIAASTGLELEARAGAGAVSAARSAFGIGRGKFMVVDQAEDAAASLLAAVPIETGTVCDLSHGRTAIRVSGPRAEWVLSKLFALDFSPAAFPVRDGKATAHHDIFAAIQRSGEDAFDIYVFRSFARAFWTTLCHAAEEVGYEAG